MHKQEDKLKRRFMLDMREALAAVVSSSERGAERKFEICWSRSVLEGLFQILNIKKKGTARANLTLALSTSFGDVGLGFAFFAHEAGACAAVRLKQ